MRAGYAVGRDSLKRWRLGVRAYQRDTARPRSTTYAVCRSRGDTVSSGVRYASVVFAIAGIVNIAVGATTFLAPLTVAELLGVPRPETTLFIELAGWLVVVLGIGYCLTAWNPERDRDLMLIGALGKLLVLPLMVSAWRRGSVGFSGVIGGAGDFVLALLFLDVLRRMRAAGAPRG